MKGKCIGLFKGTSKTGKPFRVATCVYDVPMDKGFGVRSEEVFLPADRALHTEILLHSRGVAASGFPPLCNIPHCCLP